MSVGKDVDIIPETHSEKRMFPALEVSICSAEALIRHYGFNQSNSCKGLFQRLACRGISNIPSLNIPNTMVRISEAITKDHQDLESLYKAILTSEDVDEQKRFQDQFSWELARHAVAEELVVHPAIEKVLPDGKETTDRDRREHSTVRTLSAARVYGRIKLT